MANEKRLIDANELETKFHETKMTEIFPYWKELSFDTQCELVRFGKALKKMMQNAPTVDAVEVVHGRWEDFCRDKMCCCSVCKAEFDNTCNEIHGEWYYCPNCGAKMDGDGNA